MAYAAVVLVAASILVCVCITLAGCGSSSPPPPSPSPSPFFPPSPSGDGGFQCQSDVQISNVQKITSKGMCVDDVSLFACPGFLLQKWPHTEEAVSSVRLFKASRPGDSEELISQTREAFVDWVKSYNVQVLVGSQITCDPTDDERDWTYVKLMIEALGKDHVLALEVGNELDQLWRMPDIVSNDCLNNIWSDYFYEQTRTRIEWAREKLANPELPVTSAFTGQIIWMGAGFPDTPQMKIATYLNRLFNAGEKYFAFTMNFYPIFDNTLQPDAQNHTRCDAAVAQASCYNAMSCKTIINLATARAKVKEFVSGNPKWGMTDAPLWIGEIGWSSPQPDTYDGAMKSCPAFFSKYMLYEYYKNFLQWDLTFSGGNPPERVFYFTMRDAANFGKQEYFGLVQHCEDSSCKITSADTKPPQSRLVVT